MMVWTDERVALLKRLLGGGETSFAQIAAQLGGGISRNAAIGKAHRLGLYGRTKPKAKPRPHIPKRGKARPQPVADKAMLLAAAFNFEEAQKSANQSAPKERRLTLIELTDATCKWPCGEVGHPDFYFCGADTLPGFPYCVHHCRIGYNAPAARLQQPGAGAEKR